MYSLTPTQHHCISELLDKGLSGHAIANTIGIGGDYVSNFHSKHYSSLTKSLGGYPQKAFTCWYPVCCLPHHFLKGWKCHWCCQNLTRHDQHILLYWNSKKSIQEHSNKGCNKAKMAFSLQRLNSGGLKKGYLVKWDQNQSFGVRWGRNGCGKCQERDWVIGLYSRLSRLKEVFWWSEAVCPGKDLGI